MRTAQIDVEIGGTKVAKGDWLYLSYLAANLDPSVFDEPLQFDIARANADQHIAFGYGIHFCLEPTTAKTTFVGGHKTVPIRYKLKARP
jgi:cytochrome P450